MTWRIHSWSPTTETGTVVSPHLGPWTFGREQNPDGTRDFEVGEEVILEVDCTPSGYVVRSVTAMRQRQPDHTECHEFDAINADRPFDVNVEEQSSIVLCFSLVDCCAWCSPRSWRVTFHEPTVIQGLDDDTDLSAPIFRFASSAEIKAQGLEVPPGYSAYCMVNNHGAGRDGPLVFVIAKSVDVVRVHHAPPPEP